MSIATKAIFAALVLSASTVAASAQYIVIQPATGLEYSETPYTGGSMPRPPTIGRRPGGPLGVPAPDWRAPEPVQFSSCGVARYEYLIGQHMSLAQSQGINARYFTPGAGQGTMDYRPERLNIEANDASIIWRVYCG